MKHNDELIKQIRSSKLVAQIGTTVIINKHRVREGNAQNHYKQTDKHPYTKSLKPQIDSKKTKQT